MDCSSKPLEIHVLGATPAGEVELAQDVLDSLYKENCCTKQNFFNDITLDGCCW